MTLPSGMPARVEHTHQVAERYARRVWPVASAQVDQESDTDTSHRYRSEHPREILVRWNRQFLRLSNRNGLVNNCLTRPFTVVSPTGFEPALPP